MQKEFRLYTVEGTIRALRVVPGVLNLIEYIQKGALFTGAVAGLVGQAGMLANATSLALYEGEDVEHIALLINDQLAIGTFEWLQDLKVGDEVKLVVSDLEDGPLFIHAILRKSDQLLWMPYQRASGRRELCVDMTKICGAGLMFIWILALILNFFMPALTKREMAIWIGLGGGIMMAFVGFMSVRGSLQEGLLAEDIFTALNVQKPKRFRVMPYSLMMLDTADYYDSTIFKKGFIFNFSKALAAHNKKFNLP